MNNDQQAVKLLVRAREDFQDMRKRLDNRLGKKADGASQNVEKRVFRAEDSINFNYVSNAAREKEQEIEQMLEEMLRRFDIYNKWLKKVKGVQTIAAGWIISEFDIYKANTVSKLWQYAGLNSGLVYGKKRVENKDDTYTIYTTNTLIRGDKLTTGFVAPFNKKLRVALLGILGSNFLKSLLRYRTITKEEYDATPESYRRIKQKKYQVISSAESYGRIYLDYKQRLTESDKIVKEGKKGGEMVEISWKDATPGHREQAAKRYMIKMFLQDLYVAWREIEGLPVRAPYQEEYLGHKHKDLGLEEAI